jgi:hypothetical protein
MDGFAGQQGTERIQTGVAVMHQMALCIYNTAEHHVDTITLDGHLSPTL